MKMSLLLVAMLSLFSCSKMRNENTFKEIEEIMTTSQGLDEATNRLIEFDLENPNDLSKLFISQLYSEMNLVQKSDIYLDKINSINGFEDKYKVQYYLLKIRKHYRLTEFEKVQQYIEHIKKLELVEEISEIYFLEAEIAFILKSEDAFKLYNDLWLNNTPQFSEYHFSNFLSLITARDKASDLGLEVISYIELNNGYSMGLGTVESSIYENKQQYELALISIFKELEYGFFYNRITKEKILSNLKELDRTFVQKIPKENQEDLSLLIETLSDYIYGDYKASEDYLKKLHNRFPENSYLYYLYVSSRIHGKNFDSIEIDRYIELEQFFITHPGYYASLVKLLKSNDELYSFKNVKNFLEKIIMLNPGNDVAQIAKSELINLLGLRCKAEDFYLPEEVLNQIKISIENYDSAYTVMLEKMLSLPSNYYSDRVIFTLDTFSKDYVPFLKKLRNDTNAFSEDTKQRLKLAGLI